MKKYKVDYFDESGDLSHVWVEAESKEDAIFQVESEHWDCKEIIDCYLM